VYIFSCICGVSEWAAVNWWLRGKLDETSLNSVAKLPYLAHTSPCSQAMPPNHTEQHVIFFATSWWRVDGLAGAALKPGESAIALQPSEKRAHMT
jgi:hypothetical protein